MRSLKVAVVCGLACACGGSGSGSDGGTDNTVDNAPAFVGTWTGTLTEAETEPSAGTPESTTGSLVIAETKANTLSLEAICLDGSNVTATVTSATEFSISAPFACPTTTVSSCTSVVLTYNTLTGTLAGGVLTLNGALTAAGCGVSVSSSLTFTSGPGTKK
jgi:hypothetical protein